MSGVDFVDGNFRLIFVDLRGNIYDTVSNKTRQGYVRKYTSNRRVTLFMGA